ncbi:MAG: hypothetical protein EA424_15840 [Planctomycetaceae bacterium]|nr:MAG: hypothetical protein EA424_15840 [Planctomycetaceae bacterium]
MKFPLSAVVIALIVYIGFFGGVLLSGWLLNWLVPAVEFDTALIIASVALLCLVLGLIQVLTLVLIANIQFLRSMLADHDLEEDFEDDDFEDDDEDEGDEEEDEDYGSGRGLPPLDPRQPRRSKRRRRR